MDKEYEHDGEGGQQGQSGQTADALVFAMVVICRCFIAKQKRPTAKAAAGRRTLGFSSIRTVTVGEENPLGSAAGAVRDLGADGLRHRRWLSPPLPQIFCSSPFGRMSIGMPGMVKFYHSAVAGLGDAGKPGGAHFCRNGWAGGVLRELATAGRGGFPIRHGQGQGTVFEVRVVGHLGQHLDLRREGDGLIGAGKLHLQYRFVFPKKGSSRSPLVGGLNGELGGSDAGLKRRRTGLHLPQQRFGAAQHRRMRPASSVFFGEGVPPSEGIGGLAHAAFPAGAGGMRTAPGIKAGNGDFPGCAARLWAAF